VDLLRIPGIGPDEADAVLKVIEDLTVEDAASEEVAEAEGPSDEELAEAREVAAEILGISLPKAEAGDEEERSA